MSQDVDLESLGSQGEDEEWDADRREQQPLMSAPPPYEDGRQSEADRREK